MIRTNTLLSTSMFVAMVTFASPALAGGDVGALDKLHGVFGDFDGDTALDFATGDPTNSSNAGAVDIAYGFDHTSTVDETWTRDSSGILETATAGDYFGSDLTAGDFNGDGYDDLAIGVPGDDGSSATDMGSVSVIYGSSTGLTSTGNQVWSQDTSGILDAGESYDYFGEFLEAGDFNCDGYDDLAIGVAQEDLATLSNAGAVHIIYGSSSGLSSTNNQQWTQDSSGIDDTAEADDYFGGALAAGNFNGDTSGVHACADLAVGVPGEVVNGNLLEGAVNVIYGTSSGLSSTSDQFWHQDITGIVDAAAMRDTFGARLSALDEDSDGYDDLRVIAPGESTCSSSEDGHHTIYGDSSGLTEANDYLYCGPDDEPQEFGCEYEDWYGEGSICVCSCWHSKPCAQVATALWIVGEQCDVGLLEVTCTAPSSWCE